ncbi:hypothetical protein AGMMS49992_21900 [Clostridia bacterium]|nr:hypothetical protein AGMMS49992_21900 [Clostridia bacterium]
MQPSWYQQARTALFIHWGIVTGNARWQERIPLYRTPEDMERAAGAAGFSVEPWVRAATRLRASYITLATFHSCLGYLKTWRSDIPGTPTTRRDILGELIAAAKPRGLRVILYITGDPANHAYFPGAPWIDESVWPGITNPRVWQNEYCRAVIGEVIDRYSDVAGFWFDGWNDAVICEDIFDFIHSRNPELLTIRNDFHSAPFPEEDVMSLECFGKRFDPPYDYPSACWVTPGGKECCYNIPALSDWFMTYESKPCDLALERKRLTSIITNGWVASIGLGPNIGGSFSAPIEAFLDDIGGYLSRNADALWNTTPGGLPMAAGDSHGYYTVSQDASAQNVYIHLLDIPDGGILTLPGAGLDISAAVVLPDGTPIPFTATEGVIRLSLDTTVDTLPYTIRLSIAKRRRSERFIIQEHLETLPCVTVIDLSEIHSVNGVNLYEDETSAVTIGGWAAIPNNRLRGLKVFAGVLHDQLNLVWEGELSGKRGMKSIAWPDIPARYMRLEWVDAWDSETSYTVCHENLGWERADGAIRQPTNIPIEVESWPIRHNVRAFAVNKSIYILDDHGTVFGVNEGGFNTYILRENVQDIFIDEAGRLCAVKKDEPGVLRVHAVEALLNDHIHRTKL